MQEPKEQSLLLQEVSRQLLVLEEAIANVDQTRKQLKQRSVEMKSDIQMSVSRQLETLKQHEASLLRQVDLIQQAKDAALQGQEDKLHEALGALTVALQVEEGQTSPVRDVLQRLKNMKIRPTETPTLTLKPDLMRVNSPSSSIYHGLHFGGMFDSDDSSASLPKLFEDYGDDEHHVLYRSIAESVGDCRKEISVNVPQLSQKPEDWLFMPPEDFTPIRPTTEPGHFLFPPFMSGGLKEHLDKHDDMSRVSIHQWLCDIQGQAEVEEEEADFDVLSSSAFLATASSKDSSIEVLNADEATPVFTVGSLDTSTTSLNVAMPSLLSSTLQLSQTTVPSYFTQVMSAPTNSWLLAGKEAPPQTSATYCHEVLRYFHEVSNDTKMWLQKYTETKKMEEQSLSDDQIDVSNWGLVRSGTEAQTSSSDLGMWLLSKKEPVQEDKKEKIEEKMVVVAGNEADTIQAEVEDNNKTSTDQEGTVCSASDASAKVVDCMPDAASCCKRTNMCTSNCCSATNESAVEGMQQERVARLYFDYVLQQDVDSWLLVSDISTAKDMPPVSNEKMTHCPPKFAPFFLKASSDSCWLWQGSDCRVPPCGSGDLASGVIGDQLVISSESNSVESLTALWKSRFRHDGAISAGDQKSFTSSEMDTNCPLQCSPSITNTDWLLSSDSKSEASHDQSEWLLHGNSVDRDVTPEQVWLFVPDTSPPNRNLDLLHKFDNLFEYFRQSDDDSKNWLLKASFVME